ncbi:hypothetical protein TEA_028011 [Camellia sinensis var. sinensis]|uniref:Uncharacterized protein n=1 Tax=Camellia sinensis var. sinensis TaxID=542762 RepID=A0A4S4E0U0_CAMSN|nr:hypothetical protein TEA_028011 [Camellia sinensis var. sinensis]
MIDDVPNLSFLDCRKLLSLSPNAVGANQTSEHGLLSELNVDGSMLSSGILRPSFSSIVDEVSTTLKKLSASKSDQDLASLRSPHFANSCATVDLSSPPRLTGPQVSAPIVKRNGPRTSAIGSFKVSGSSPWATATISEAPDFAVSPSSNLDAVTRHDRRSRKRTVSDMLNVIPSLQCLELQSDLADSSKKLVADIQRLSNARMFALGMQKLLGVRPDEKLEEDNANSDGKATAGAKSALEASDKFLEQMRRAFRIEAVGS